MNFFNKVSVYLINTVISWIGIEVGSKSYLLGNIVNNGRDCGFLTEFTIGNPNTINVTMRKLHLCNR